MKKHEMQGYFPGCKKKGFHYVDIVTNGYEGCINLFFDDICIALIEYTELAEAIKKHVDNQEKTCKWEVCLRGFKPKCLNGAYTHLLIGESFQNINFCLFCGCKIVK